MNYNSLLSALILIFVFSCGTSSQQESNDDQITSDETEKMDDEVSYSDENEMKLERPSATPPSEEEVGIPYYPGADYIPSSGSIGLLLMFATKDSPAEVTAFYKDKLPDWTYNEAYGLFWEGSGDLGYAKILETKKTVSVVEYEVEPYKAAVNITVPAE